MTVINILIGMFNFVYIETFIHELEYAANSTHN